MERDHVGAFGNDGPATIAKSKRLYLFFHWKAWGQFAVVVETAVWQTLQAVVLLGLVPPCCEANSLMEPPPRDPLWQTPQLAMLYAFAWYWIAW